MASHEAGISRIQIPRCGILQHIESPRIKNHTIGQEQSGGSTRHTISLTACVTVLKALRTVYAPPSFFMSRESYEWLNKYVFFSFFPAPCRTTSLWALVLEQHHRRLPANAARVRASKFQRHYHEQERHSEFDTKQGGPRLGRPSAIHCQWDASSRHTSGSPPVLRL